MKQNDQKIYLFLGGIVIFMVAGFYFMFSQLNGMSQNLQSLQTQIQTQNFQNQISNLATTTASSSQSGASTTPVATAGSPIDIPTTILFTASSSPLLTPQTSLTITIQDVSKAADGTVTINLKVFANNAASYSALDVNNDFQLIVLNGTNQSPLSANGQLNAIPPQGAATGSLTFKTDPANNVVILQIGVGDQIKYYQFDFGSQNYKQTIVG